LNTAGENPLLFLMGRMKLPVHATGVASCVVFCASYAYTYSGLVGVDYSDAFTITVALKDK